MASKAYRDWLADGSPWKFARPVRAIGDRLREHGYTVYFEGNDAHLQKATPEDHCPFSATGWPGPSPYPYCMATDIMPPRPGQTSKLTGRPLPSLQRLAAVLRADRIAGNPEAAFLKYMNHEPDGDNTGPCWHDSWQPTYARIASDDREHIHLSARSDSHLSMASDGYDLVARAEENVTIFGWDSSHYDAPDQHAAVAEGFQFLTHKAGGDADDGELSAWWNVMKPYRDRVMLGAYWVQYPGNPLGRADAFVARLDSQCAGWRDGPFILQVDCEIWGGDLSTRPGLSDIRAFCNRLRWHMPKLLPIVYAPKWAYDLSGVPLNGLGFPLWASAYVSGSGSASKLYPGDNAARWNAYSGQVPAVLQFTSSATIAGQTTCDANAFRGSLAQLQAKLAPGWVASIGADDMSAADAQQGILDAFNLAAATTDADQTGDTPYGRQFRTAFDKLMDAVEGTGPLMDAVKAVAANQAAHSQLLAALVAMAQNEAVEVPPTAQAIADAFLADMNGLSPQEAAQALASVLTPAALVALMAALQELITHPPARAVDEPADVDIFTQTQRGIAQQRIQEGEQA
jgi:hypothetical protein